MLISCYLIGSDDEPPKNTLNDRFNEADGDLFAGKPDEQLTPEQLTLRKNRQKNIGILGRPDLYIKTYQLYINIVRMEDIPSLSTFGTNAFVSAKVSNQILTTQVVKNSLKPEFSCRLKFPVSYPSLNDKIVMKAWDYSKMRDTFIGNIPENPFIDSWFNINYLQSTSNFPFTWINIYGIPINERKSEFAKLFGKKNNLVEGNHSRFLID